MGIETRAKKCPAQTSIWKLSHCQNQFELIFDQVKRRFQLFQTAGQSALAQQHRGHSTCQPSPPHTEHPQTALVPANQQSIKAFQKGPPWKENHISDYMVKGHVNLHTTNQPHSKSRLSTIFSRSVFENTTNRLDFVMPHAIHQPRTELFLLTRKNKEYIQK